MINQQYPYMEDVSGTNGGMQDTRSQDALHQALLLRTSQANPQVQANQQNNNMLAQMLKQGNKNNPTKPATDSTGAPVTDYSTPYNPATGQSWDVTGSGLAGNGGYDPTAMGGMNDYLSQMGLDTGGFTGAGSFDLGSLLGGGSSAAGGGITDFLGSLFGGGAASGGAVAGGDLLAEAAPLLLLA